MEKIRNGISFLEGKLLAFLDAQIPVVHTAYQAAFGVLASGLLLSRSSADVKLAVAAALATFLAALKAAYLKARG